MSSNDLNTKMLPLGIVLPPFLYSHRPSPHLLLDACFLEFRTYISGGILIIKNSGTLFLFPALQDVFSPVQDTR